jgi:hypothetical protein
MLPLRVAWMPVGAPASALEFVPACHGPEDGGQQLQKVGQRRARRLGGQNRELRTE